MDYPGKVITKTQVTPTQTSASGNWTLDDQAAAIKNNNWPVALVPNPISKSLRFNSADGTNLTRTQTSSVTNSKIYTISVWVKRSGFGASQVFEGADSLVANYWGQISFASDNSLFFGDYNPSSNSYLQTTAVYRDPSAWYHIVGAYDTTQATASDRMKLYVNGVQLTSFSASAYPTQNTNSTNNFANNVQRIGEFYQSGVYNQFNGYMTEYNFIDGQALTPSSFGMTNPQTGQWIPLKYSGTYGTNGFYLNFKDATSTTTLGYDYSGNANNWTTNNFSVTAGAGNDSLTDVPTPWVAYNTTGDVGGVIRGNYATLNPLRPLQSGDSLSDGNLTITTGTTATGVYPATIGISSGKWYWEVLMVTQPAANTGGVGVAKQGITASFTTGSVLYENSTGNKYIDGTASAYGATWQTNDIIACAYNADTGTFEFFKNGSSQGSFTASGYAGVLVFPVMADGTGQSLTHTYNFGQRPFAYTPPTGFRSLCTTNLPATAIGFGLTNQGDDYFNTLIYNGSATSQNITGVGFSPDLVWIKTRSNAESHQLVDQVRGATKAIMSNETSAETTWTNGLSAFLSDGFTLPGGNNRYSDTGYTYVAWNWNAGGSNATNTSGTITSTVRANTTAKFSIVTYTGTGANATVGHGLGVTPGMIIIKNRNAVVSWPVWHQSLSSNTQVYLNNTLAAESGDISSVGSSTFAVDSWSGVNGSGNGMVAYCFAAVAGYSAFGSYTGNGSADGPFVYLGFRPRFVMVKEATVSARDWIILDSARNTYNVADLQLMPNKSDAEATTVLSSTAYLDFVSNGFKVRNTSVRNNENTATYIYAAFAEFPFQFANAR